MNRLQLVLVKTLWKVLNAFGKSMKEEYVSLLGDTNTEKGLKWWSSVTY